MANNNRNYVDNTVGAYHLSDPLNYNLYEVQRNSHYEFLVPADMNGLFRDGSFVYENNSADKLTGNMQEVIRYSVTAAFFPKLQQDEIEIVRGNSSMYAAGKPSWTGGSIRINDFIGSESKEYLYAWRRLSYDLRTDKVGRMADYKKTATLCEYTQDYELIRTWTLEGVFITKVSDDEFNREQDGKRQLKVEFSYDRAIMDLPEVEEVEEQNQ